MPGPMPLLSLMEELYRRIQEDKPASSLFGGGVAGAATRGLLGADSPPDATPTEMEVYRNFGNASMALAAGPVAATRAMRGAKSAKTLAPQAQALETARQNAVRMLNLPESNTAMDRAKAMGFDTPAVHFSRHGVDVRELDSGKVAYAPFDAVGTHVGSPQAAFERFQNTVGYKVNNPSYALDELKGVTYPVLIRRGKEFLSTDKPWVETALSSQLRKRGGHDWSDINRGSQTYSEMNEALRKKLFQEYGSIPYVNDVEAKGTISYIVPPKNIRSRFAAFDPARIDEKDLLASLAAMGITLPLTMGLLSEQPD